MDALDDRKQPYRVADRDPDGRVTAPLEERQERHVVVSGSVEPAIGLHPSRDDHAIEILELQLVLDYLDESS